MIDIQTQRQEKILNGILLRWPTTRVGVSQLDRISRLCRRDNRNQPRCGGSSRRWLGLPVRMPHTLLLPGSLLGLLFFLLREATSHRLSPIANESDPQRKCLPWLIRQGQGEACWGDLSRHLSLSVVL